MSKKTSSGSVGLSGLLVVLFIGLKLTGHINWSWWWVLSPLWISMALGVFILVAAIVIWIFVRKDRK